MCVCTPLSTSLPLALFLVLLIICIAFRFEGCRCETADVDSVLLLVRGPSKSSSFKEWLKGVKKGLEEAIIEGYKNVKRGFSVTSMSQCPLFERSYDSKIWVELTRHAVDNFGLHEILFHVKRLRANRKTGPLMGREVFMSSSEVVAAMKAIRFQELMSLVGIKVIGYKEAAQYITPTITTKSLNTMTPSDSGFGSGKLASGESDDESEDYHPTTEVKATTDLKATTDVKATTDQTPVGSRITDDDIVGYTTDTEIIEYSPTSSVDEVVFETTGKATDKSGPTLRSTDPPHEAKATNKSLPTLRSTNPPRLVEVSTDQDDGDSGSGDDYSDVEVSSSGSVNTADLSFTHDQVKENKRVKGFVPKSGTVLDFHHFTQRFTHNDIVMVHPHIVRSVPDQVNHEIQKRSSLHQTEDSFISDWSHSHLDFMKEETDGAIESSDHDSYRKLLKKCFPRYVNRLMNSLLRTEHCTVMHYLGRHTAAGTENIVRAMKAEGYTSHDCVSDQPVTVSTSSATEAATEAATTSETHQVIATSGFVETVMPNNFEGTEREVTEETKRIVIKVTAETEIELTSVLPSNPQFEAKELQSSGVEVALYVVIALICVAVVVAVVSLAVYVHRRKKLEIAQGMSVSTKVRILSCNTTTAAVEVADDNDSVDSCSVGGLQLEWDESSVDIPPEETTNSTD